MIIKNISNAPFTPNRISGKQVRIILFNKIAICY